MLALNFSQTIIKYVIYNFTEVRAVDP